MEKFKYLDRYYQAIVAAETEKGFFLLLDDYVNQLFEEDSIISIIAKYVTDPRSELQAKLNSEEKKVIKECKAFFDAHSSDWETTKNEYIGIADEMSHFQQLLSRHIQSSNPLGKELVSSIQSIIWDIDQTKFKHLVTQMIEGEPPTRSINTHLISKSYENYLILQNKFDDGLKYALWGCWNDLLLFHQVKDEGTERVKDLYAQGKTWDAINYSGIAGEIVDILEDNERKGYKFFTRKEMQLRFTRLHLFLMIRIDKIFEKVHSHDKAAPITKTDSTKYTKIEKLIVHDSGSIECGKIRLNINSAIISIDGGETVHNITSRSEEMKFLKVLMDNSPNVVSNEEIGKAIESKDEGTVLNGKVSAVKRDLRGKLIAYGLDKSKFDQFIVNDRAKGYKLLPLN